MDYKAQLEAAKAAYPFEDWRSNEADGLEQYTEENCQKAKQIFDSLIAELAILGESATQKEKLKKFKIAVEALNDLNDETEGSLIETGEREQLCELLEIIGMKAQLNPLNHKNGESVTTQWRDW